MTEVVDALFGAIDDEQRVGVATVSSGGDMGAKLLIDAEGGVLGTLPVDVHDAVVERGRALLATGETTSFEVGRAGEPVEIFFETHSPPEKLIVVGAVHVAIPLVAIASSLGFHTTVIDARAVYATPERFPHVDELVVRWPAEALAEMNLHPSTYCVFLTHDEKLDNPGLEVAVRSSARYVGALGSRRTHAKRVDGLRERGLDDEEIGRIHAPIGLRLGGNRPEEIALSIAAEMVAVRNGQRE